MQRIPRKWWEISRDETPKLKRFGVRVLSLTCSSSSDKIVFDANVDHELCYRGSLIVMKKMIRGLDTKT